MRLEFRRVLFRSPNRPIAYIPFTPERPGQLEVINAYLHGLGIYPVGRFGEWKYVNQDGAILSAKRVVESIRSEGKLAANVAPLGPNHPSPPDRKTGPAATVSALVRGQSNGAGRVEVR